MLKNRTILGIFCTLLAVTVMFGVLPLIDKAAASKTKVVRVKNDITQGRQITTQDLAIVEVGSYNLPVSVIKRINDVIGKFAATDLKSGDYLFPAKLSDDADSADDVFHTLDGSKRAMSITIDSFADGLSGKLRSGDIVSIIVANRSADTVIPPELIYVKVITTTTDKGNDSNELSSNKPGVAELPKTVTLLVTPAQARLLAHYEVGGKIHIALVYRGDKTTADQFLSVQEKLFTQGEVKK